MSTKQTGKAAEEKQSRQVYKKARKKENKRRESRASEEKAAKTQTRKQRKERRNAKKPRRRIFPLWLRIIVVLILAAGALVAGLMIGFGVIGDGTPTDILKVETWQHIIDIVVGDA
ncbi:DNA-directed RNA polymerase subunit beta [Virgibacillus sp. YIM 98842]|jgi:anti-sigma factor RsiW|uniref:DNA-directed RNA polymerase subunit beta n=1 Tax=Virgibacillus sp. YIM 98842 TaxID=2663533 RepID=UPI0013DBB79B|nr:DNA-directed RNA polymerase subunit beta [Virgibacillus sp. YIM 98842]